MRIAVVHHRCRDEAALDAAALVDAVGRACADGAHVVVCPRIPALTGLAGPQREALLADIDGCAEGVALLMSFAAGDASAGRVVDTPLGRTALASGDTCLKPETAQSTRDAGVHAVVWRPGAESELQAEAIVEYTLGCAPLLAGLVVLAESAGGPSNPGKNGTSVIIHLGELVAESVGVDDEILFFEVAEALPAPETDLPLPAVPPLLQQRVAAHEGRKVSVEYPADLS